MSEKPEVIIIGGGPGGSTLASCLALKGRRSIVFERDRFPRFHIGESLLPRSLEVFRKLGLMPKLEERYIRKYGARFLCSDTRRINQYSFDDAFDSKGFEHAYQVPRDDFDHVLLKHAIELGADVREEWEVTEVIFEGTRAVGVRARPVKDKKPAGPVEEFRAPLVVDATGRDTFLASKMRQKAPLARLDKTALFSQYIGAFRQEGKDEGNIQLPVFEHGWFWIIPFKGEVTSAGVVLSAEFMKTRTKGESLDELKDRAIAQSCWATEMLSGAKRIIPVRAIADFSYRIDQLTGDGWLFVGDAGGFIDPLFSTGAHLAVKGADLAADAIDRALTTGDTSRAAFTDYEARVRYAVDLFLGVVQAFYAGEFRETLFEPNQRLTMRRLITTILSGDVFHDQDRRPPWVAMIQKQYAPTVPRFS